MRKPVIAVDVDEVLSPYIDGLIHWHNREYGTALQVNDFHTYEFHKVWGGSRDEAIAKGTAYFENRGPVQPMAEANSVLTRLQQHYEFIVVTSRPLEHKPQTEEWIQQHFPKIFNTIVVCNHWTLNNSGPVIKKSAACVTHGAHYLIDDMPHYAADAAAAGIKALLFGNYPWNQQPASAPQIQRVANWLAVEDYFGRQLKL